MYEYLILAFITRETNLKNSFMSDVDVNVKRYKEKARVGFSRPCHSSDRYIIVSRNFDNLNSLGEGSHVLCGTILFIDLNVLSHRFRLQ